VSTAIKAEVEEALGEIRASFGLFRVDVEADDQGGAFVRVHDVPIGTGFIPNVSWIGFQITFQYPFADVYPHFLRSDLARANGQPLAKPLNPGSAFALPSGAISAVLLSRASRSRDPVTDTAAVKLAKVIDWLRIQ
jgi:hypothetical protein